MEDFIERNNLTVLKKMELTSNEAVKQALLAGLGYSIILIVVAVCRELFGKGSLLGYKIIGPTAEYALNTSSTSWLNWYTANNLAILSPAAMFLIAIFIWIQRSRNPKLVDIS